VVGDEGDIHGAQATFVARLPPSPVRDGRWFSRPWGGSSWEGPAGDEGRFRDALAFRECQ
jgi:hypothetical protein